MELKTVVSKLQSVAPLDLAENWDNVGLLLEPSPPHHVERLFLTNDLTEPVLEEALNVHRANMILSYHPPIFASFKNITFKTWKERIVIRCLENRIAVYSPHTSFDVVSNGITDWLISAFDVHDVLPVVSKSADSIFGLVYKMKIPIPVSEMDSIMEKLNELIKIDSALENIIITLQSKNNDDKYSLLKVECSELVSKKILNLLNSLPDVDKSIKISRSKKLIHPGCGLGRKGRLNDPLSISDALELVKNHCGLKALRVGLGYGKSFDSKLNTVAVCCGSGASVLKGVKADLYLTGEMSHHEVLDAVSRGVTVILTEHSNSERGFLRAQVPRLKELLDNKVDIIVSEVDKDPLVCL